MVLMSGKCPESKACTLGRGPDTGVNITFVPLVGNREIEDGEEVIGHSDQAGYIGQVYKIHVTVIPALTVVPTAETASIFVPLVGSRKI